MRMILLGIVVIAGAIAPARLAADPTPLVAPVAAPVPAETQVPVEVFAALPTFADPQLSPDGNRIASRMAIDGRQYFVVMTLRGIVKPAVLAVRDDMDINWWRWVGNDWLAVGVGAQNVVYGDEVYVTRTLGVSADAKTVNRIGWTNDGIRGDDLIWAANDGSARILVAQQTGITTMEQIAPSVVEADLATGRSRIVVRGRANVWNWVADGTGVVRLGIGYDDDSRSSKLLYRTATGEEFGVIARAKGEAMQAVPIPLVFRADGTALALADRDGRDAVYEVTLPDLKLGKRLYGDPRYDVDGIYYTPARDDIAGYSITGTHARSEWIATDFKEIQALVDKAAGKLRPRIVSWSRDRRKLLLEAGGPAQAGALYYWDVDGGGTMNHLAWYNPALKGRALSPVSTIRYAARDGTEIEAVLTLPHGRPAKALPIIVLPHGGPAARDSEQWDWWVQYLAEIGYAVIQPNYRGSTGYGTALARKGRGQWGLAMQEDLNDALAWAVGQGIADPKRACLVGASYGGYAAMRGAQRDGALYRCAIAFAGVSDLALMRQYDSQFLNGKTLGDWLKTQAPDFKSVSPRFGAAQVSIPILLVHGKLDKRVPVKQSRLMAAALKDAGKPYEYIEQPKGDHHFTRGEDRLEFLKASKAFLDKHNPA